LLVNKECY